MMRTFCTALFFSVSPTAGLTQEHSHSEVPYGTYGYKHSLLHQFGIIEKLLQRTQKSCCDGGVGGECRGTVIRSNVEQKTWEFKHGNIWCPVSSEIILDIDFPSELTTEGIHAVVCAGKTAPNVCPSRTYCSARSYNPG